MVRIHKRYYFGREKAARPTYNCATLKPSVQFHDCPSLAAGFYEVHDTKYYVAVPSVFSLDWGPYTGAVVDLPLPHYLRYRVYLW